ncbi:MAG: hypothetical protein ACRCWI_06255 [Brevinema sp.]
MKLISLKNIEEIYTEGQNKLVISSKQIITPSVHDFFRSKGVSIVYYDTKSKNPPSTSSSSTSVDSELITRITSLLVNKYKITNTQELTLLVTKVINKIKDIP